MRNPKKAFFKKLDCPLSALACNCLQITCCFPGRHTYCTYNSTANTADWMGQLVADMNDHDDDGAGTMVLRDLIVPGSHDSASGTIGTLKPFSAAGRTQNLSVGDQLLAGARYLDVRIAAASKTDRPLSIWHGCLEGGDYESVLHEIHDFCTAHPKEVVLLELVPEFGRKFSGEEKRKCFDMALEVLGADKIIPGSQLGDIIEHRPFRQVSGQPQRIAVLLHDRFWEGDDFKMTESEVADKYGFALSKQTMRNPWNDTRLLPELLDKNLTSVTQFESARGKLLCNQFLVTPGIGGVPDVVAVVTGQNSLRPVSHACRLYDTGVLDGFLRTHCDKVWNIVALDFLDLCPDIADFLIALNWSHRTLHVETAYVHVASSSTKDVDVTAKLQSFVCRQRVLFLVDPDKDLGISEEHFTLTVAYSMTKTSRGGKSGGARIPQYFVTTIDVHCDAPIIVSAFCCNEGALRVEVTDDNGASGVIHRGKHYISKGEVPKGGPGGTSIEYNIEGGKASFTAVS